MFKPLQFCPSCIKIIREKARALFQFFLSCIRGTQYIIAFASDKYFQFFLSCICPSRWGSSRAKCPRCLSILSELHQAPGRARRGGQEHFAFNSFWVASCSDAYNSALATVSTFNSFWVASCWTMLAKSSMSRTFNSFWVASKTPGKWHKRGKENIELSILSELHPHMKTAVRERSLWLSILSELHPNFSTRGGLYV